MANIIRELEKKLKACNLKQCDLAEVTGISQPMVSMVLKGKRVPPTELLEWVGYERIVTTRVIYRKVNGE